MAIPSRTEIFNPRLIAALVAAGILAFVAFVLLSAYAGDFRSGRDGRGHALSVSAVGFKGIVQLVDDVGGLAWMLRTAAGPEDEDLLVVAVEPTTKPEALEQLLDERGARATLLILPKWIAPPHPSNPGWVMNAGTLPGVPALAALPQRLRVRTGGYDGQTAVGQGLLDGIAVRAPPQTRTIEGEGVAPLLSVPAGGALIARIGGGQLYVLADPDLMNNHGLKNPQQARAALQILAALNTTDAQAVNFDLTLNGFGSKPSLLKLPFDPPFLSLTLALFVAALLAGIHGAFRFGPTAHEERAISFGKLALVENSAGLIQLARREHRAGGAYADLVRDAAVQATGAPPSLRGAELEAYLDRLSPPDAPKFSALAERARNAADSHELVSAARALFAWKKEYTQ